MGLTLLRRGAHPPKPQPKLALVLAGGAISGGAFKVGGLRALDEQLSGRTLGDFDMYIGLSAGALLAVALASGITPVEMARVLEGRSQRLDPISPLHFYRPNLSEGLGRPRRFLYEALAYAPGVLWDFARELPGLPRALGPGLRAFWREPGIDTAEQVAQALFEHARPGRPTPDPMKHIPTGVFQNDGLERWLRGNLERIGMPNDFARFERQQGRQLFVSACALDTSERVIFGKGEHEDVPISKSVQAATALPLFYRPVRIAGVDYVDAGIRNTANIDLAIEKGADLIVCYNPFSPLPNRRDDEGRYSVGGALADRGLMMVVSQVFRTLIHARLHTTLQRVAESASFEGDIVLIEPREDDADYFAISPLAFWRRGDALRAGFSSVRRTIEQNFRELDEVFARYGLQLERRGGLRGRPPADLKNPHPNPEGLHPSPSF